MREIKFRAWDKVQKEMYHKGFHISYDGRLECTFGLYPSPVIELMQFTGLLDKNGKEIYEGDILQYHSAVVAKGQNPIIKQIVQWAGWHYEGIRNWKQSEVIGNIYENPKLLGHQ